MNLTLSTFIKTYDNALTEEFCQKVCDKFDKAGMIFAGMSPDNILPETLELNDHPWFIAVQFHPELKSRPFQPHPLFVSFINASLNQSRLL